jgi:rod shape-determining protein MreD
MQMFFLPLYILVVLVVQTVVFPRLNILGASPDLILVSVILFSILNQRDKSIVFAAGTGILQDILSFGAYINIISKVFVAFIVGMLKESFMGDELQFGLLLVLVFTPLSLFVEMGFFSFFNLREISLNSLYLDIVLITIYNLVMVPVLFPFIKLLSHD